MYNEKIKQLYDWRLKETNIPIGSKIKLPEDVYKNFRFYFEKKIRECFVVFSLLTDNHVIGFEEVSSGSSSAVIANPKEIFLSAIAFNANGIIIAHNHPTGNLKFSKEDLNITKRIKEGGDILGIPLLDHIIFTDNGYLSAMESGKF